MIIERFKPGKLEAIYERFDRNGRMLPDGLLYLDSWVDNELSTCYQIMESESVKLVEDWIQSWSDLVDFEIIPVLNSLEAREMHYKSGQSR